MYEKALTAGIVLTTKREKPNERNSFFQPPNPFTTSKGVGTTIWAAMVFSENEPLYFSATGASSSFVGNI
jgi:hypothetical protein